MYIHLPDKAAYHGESRNQSLFLSDIQMIPAIAAEDVPPTDGGVPSDQSRKEDLSMFPSRLNNVNPRGGNSKSYDLSKSGPRRSDHMRIEEFGLHPHGAMTENWNSCAATAVKPHFQT
jgi:hypothetical protein